jgi:alpha-tubulin suppressor-like RCC1 family protein
MTIALKTDGTFWSWGYNFAGSLGLGGAASRSSPTQVPGTDWNTGIRNTSNGWAAFKLL